MKFKCYVNEKDLNDYEKEHKRLSYSNLLKCCNINTFILCNDILKYFPMYEKSELISGSDYDEETDEYVEFFQYYIINSNFDADLVKLFNIPIYYIEDLDIYVLAVSHYGTSWSYVLTDVSYTFDFDEYLKMLEAIR